MRDRKGSQPPITPLLYIRLVAAKALLLPPTAVSPPSPTAGHYAICHAALHVMHNQAAAATSHMRGEMLSGSSGGSFQVHAAIGKIAQSLIDYSAANPTDTETHSRVCYTLLMISSMGPEEDNFTGFESAPPTSAVDGVSFTRLQPAWAYVEPAALGAFLSRCCSLLHWNHQVH